MNASGVPEANDPVARDNRLTTILLIGRISTGARDDLCRIRNISAGGMRIETLAPIEVGQQISVELKSGIAVCSVVVWINGGEAGVKFEEPVDIEQLLATSTRPHPTLDARTPRSPRLSARCPVTLRRDGHIQSGVLEDVSQGGAQLCSHGTAKIGDRVTLYIPGLGSKRATIRWVTDETVGLSFAERLGFADLARWLASPERFTRTTANALNRGRQNS
ncbi:PilZ domain-containing protein [Sphingomonas sp. RT2P30]|uniref:PilZ domain-containing protein n=1 Tax=Parasphingomonas halimpatiens TaxID=3096162 RepID=UPI002FC82AD0